MARAKAKATKEETVKEYIAKFYETVKCQNFVMYWRRFGYAKVVERVKKNFPDLDVAELSAEFSYEGPQTPIEEAVEEGALVEKPVDEPAIDVPTTKLVTPSHLSRRVVFWVFFCNGHNL